MPIFPIFLFDNFFSLSIVQEIFYEQIKPSHNAANLQESTEFNFVIPPRTDYFTRCLSNIKSFFLNNVILICLCCSFNTDYQMVVDAQVVVSVSQNNVAQPRELLYPPRHQITLPLNNLNIIFDKIDVAFNQTSKLNADK
jgi:hypothetical protein